MDEKVGYIDGDHKHFLKPSELLLIPAIAFLPEGVVFKAIGAGKV